MSQYSIWLAYTWGMLISTVTGRLMTVSYTHLKFEGVEVNETHIDAVRQKMGMVFQHFNLFPHLTVKKNLELCLLYTSMNILPWYHLGSLYPYGYGLDAAAACTAYSRTL